MSRLEKYLTISQEEFEEEHVPQEEWVELPETQMDDIQEGIETKEALDSLAEKVEEAPEEASLEAYDWSYRTITQLMGIAPSVYPSLESFEEPALKKSELSKSIRAFSNRLDLAITASIEDYTESFGNSLKEIVTSITTSAAKLKSEANSVEGVPSKMVEIDHRRIWNMVHVAGKKPKHLADLSRAESDSLKKLLQIARDAASSLKNNQDSKSALNNADGQSVSLMFNTTVTISGGKAIFDKSNVPTPKAVKTGSDKNRGMLIGFAIGLFIPIPFSSIAGAYIGRKNASATGSEAVSKRDVDDALSFLKAVADYSQLTRDIESIAETLSQSVEEAGEDKTAAKRAAAPVMELLGGIGRHIADVMYGGSILAEALADAK